MYVYKTTLFIMFLIFPVSIMEYFGLGMLDSIWFYAAILISLMLLIKYREIEKSLLFGVLIQLVYSIWQIYSTSMAGGNTAVDNINLRYQIGRMIILLVVFGLYKSQVLLVLNRLLFAAGCINFISILVRAVIRHSLSLTADEVYFLGYRYVFATYAVIVLFLGYICKDYSIAENRIYKCQFTMLWITALIAGPSTLLAGLLVYTILMYGTDWSINSKVLKIKMNWFWMTIISVGLNIGIIFFNIQEKFSFIIKNILHRDVTFTGRSIIWETSLEAYSTGNPWLGLGNSLAFGYNGWGHLGWEEQKFASHSQILTWLTNTGIVGVLIQTLFFVWILILIIKMRSERLKKIMGVCMTMMIIMSTSTQYVPYRYIEFFGFVIAYIYSNHQYEESIFELEENV